MSRALSNIGLPAAQSLDVDERCQLFVARHKGTGLYNTRAQYFLRGNQAWIEAAQPTAQEVTEELASSDSRKSMWSSDLQDAEVWDSYWMAKYQQYVPEVEFIPVRLSGQPIG
ncbi:hypothetical protein F6X40_36345 [Paraburkholderia sp. UCT31]|uniref:hypothetical protein n=1 Tax=Paraburkholderia sp. UCT31 TaxID=2615209 RepID=UPI001655BB75|nr:hypothetical protein [Paraburkholderia sp. UCT31]MBC8742012.1 hypothetical protein [Paraburkholderia sp. UCT31]